MAARRIILPGDHLYRGTARDFDGSSSYLSKSVPLITAAPITVAVWFYFDTFQDQCLWTTQNTGTSSNYWELLFADVNDAVAWEANDGSSGNAIGTSALTSGRWYHVAGIEYSTTLRSVFLDGIKEGSDTEPHSPTGLDGSRIGVWDGDSQFEFLNGSVAWVTTWDVALEAWEIRQAAQGRHHLTIRPDSIISCVPSTGRTPEIDLVKGVGDWTVNGTDATVRTAPPRFDKYELFPPVARAPDFVLEQEGYRWRDDDGSESAASWLELQDTDITRAKSTNTRLRTLVDATGNPLNQAATLQYRKVGDAETEWRAAPLT